MSIWNLKKPPLKLWRSPRGSVEMFQSGRKDYLIRSSALPYLVVLEELRLANSLFSAHVNLLSSEDE